MLNMKINLLVSNVSLGRKYQFCLYVVTGEIAELQTLNDRVNGKTLLELVIVEHLVLKADGDRTSVTIKAVVNIVHKPCNGFLVHQSPFYPGGLTVREVKSEYTSTMNSVNS